MTVVPLHPTTVIDDKRSGDPEVILWAKDLLERAESGDIDGFVVVAHNADNSIQHMHVGYVRSCGVVGGLAYMQFHLNAEINKL